MVWVGILPLVGMVGWCRELAFFPCSQTAVYANVQDLYLDDDSAEEEEDSTYGYGDEKIYDSVCFYQHPVSN